MVGLNFATSFLRRDGKQSADMGWEDVLAHLDHLITHLGEDHVGMGSDFDGATMPQGISDVAGLPALQQAMLDHGYGDGADAKLTHENWLRPAGSDLGGVRSRLFACQGKPWPASLHASVRENPARQLVPKEQPPR